MAAACVLPVLQPADAGDVHDLHDDGPVRVGENFITMLKFRDPVTL